MRSSTDKKIAAIALGAVAVSATGVGYAYWTTTGTGTGTGATTAGVTDQLSFTQTALKAMHPGDSAQTLSVEVENTASESAYVGTVRAFVTTDKTGCTGADFLLGGTAAPSTAATARALTWTATELVAGGSASATSTLQFNDTPRDQDVCKSAVVTVNYLAS